jgi:probable F420-dependent oxidoreductase
MKFSIGIPTCREGLYVPVGFAKLAEIVRMAQVAEELEFHAVWGNDHLSIPGHLRQFTTGNANFYDPLIVLSHIAAVTHRLQLGVGIVVLPLRDPVYLAKQAATLDGLSDGRLLLGVGIGSIREEFEAVQRPGTDTHRGKIMDEGLEIITRLFREDSVSFDGDYNYFTDLRLYPKPVQTPFPLYVAGTHPNAIDRVVKWGNGWLIAGSTADRIRQSVERLEAATDLAGRDIEEIEIVACSNPRRGGVGLPKQPHRETLHAAGRRGAVPSSGRIQSGRHC